MRFLSPLLAALGVVSTSLAQTPPAATIAVVVEPAAVANTGTPSIPPAKIPGLLEKYGLHAQAFTLAQLAEQKLDPKQYPVLVIPYGDTYIASSLPAVRAYHQAGGSLIVNGIAFGRPVHKEGGEWKEDANHGKAYLHDEQGVGTGGFSHPAAPVTERIAHYGFQANPLGLDDTETPLPPYAKDKPPTCLNPTTLDPKDEVIPLVEALDAKGKSYPVSAIVRHKCADFNGANDIWIGQVAPHMEGPDAYFAEQMLVRGTAWCLREKGDLNTAQTEAIFASVAKAGQPAPPPSGLAYTPRPRPWGDTFLPRSHPPARRLLVVDMSKCKPDIRAALECLQGLTSRQQPAIWLLPSGKNNNAFWLDELVTKHFIDGYDMVANPDDLFKKFASAYKGAIIPDPALYRGNILAANVAACEDLIVATPELAAHLGIPVKIDLRGRYTSYADGMLDIWKTYQSKLNHFLCDITNGKNGLNSYAIQWRAVMFWPCGPVDAAQPGADLMRDKSAVAQIMSEMEPNTALLGFPFAGEGVGIGEVAGVALASSYGLPLICSDSIMNVCVTSGFPISTLKQIAQPPAPPLEKDKIYIALALSDGDNQQVWNGFVRRYFEHPRFGDFPLAFGLGPPAFDMQPAVIQWYYEHAKPNTEFIADVSGIGYIQPENYGKNYSDPKAVFGGFLDWTNKYQACIDLKTLRPVNGDDELLTRYASSVKGMHSIFADMGRYTGREGIKNLTVTLPDGMAVFHAVTSWRYGKEGFLKEVRDQVGPQRPAFVNGFVHCWTFDMDAIVKIYDQRDTDMVFVTPTQLATLYKEAKSKGWTQ